MRREKGGIKLENLEYAGISGSWKRLLGGAGLSAEERSREYLPKNCNMYGLRLV